VWHHVPGERVVEGEPLLTLYTDDEARFAGALDALTGAVEVGPPGTVVHRLPLVLDRVGGQ
jgi:thymidine phosphorylase